MANIYSLAAGQGNSTISGTTITNTGAGIANWMMLPTDYTTQAGVVNPTDLFVAQHSTPNMSVDVSAGSGYILNGSYALNSVSQNEFWRFVSDSLQTATIATADPSNPRIDLVCAKFNVAGTPDQNASNMVTIISSGTDTALKGTAAGAPSAPATPSNYLLLAQVTVGAGVTSIVQANITDKRARADIAANVDGWVPLVTSATFARASSTTITPPTGFDPTTVLCVGDKIKLTDTTTKYFYVTAVTSTLITIYAGSDYTLVGTPSSIWYSHGNAVGFPEWIDFTPVWSNLTVGNGTLYGRYQQFGKTLHFEVAFTMGSTSSMNANVPALTLPVSINSSWSYYIAIGIGTVLKAGAATYPANMIRSGEIFIGVLPSGTYIRGGGVTQNIPVTFTTNDGWFFSGTYETA